MVARLGTLVVMLGIGFAIACTPASGPAAEKAPATTQPAQAAGKAAPSTIEELATYSGADRQQILEAGARKEGKVTWYTTTIKDTMGQPIIDAFTKKYPYLQVEFYRANADDLRTRILDEAKAGRHTFDIVEMSMGGFVYLLTDDVLHPFDSPWIKEYPADAKDANGLWVQTYQLYPGIGFNTNLVAEQDAPKSFEDLLDPRWKGKMSVPSGNLVVDWVGGIVETKGEDFFKKLAQQDIRYREVSSTALVNLIGSGEVPIDPLAQSKDIMQNKRKGAPIGWNPTKPIVPNTTSVGLSRQAPHPHAALLLIDFKLSMADGEGQTITVKQDYGSPVPGEEYGKYELLHLSQMPDYFQKRERWEDLLKQYIIKSS